MSELPAEINDAWCIVHGWVPWIMEVGQGQYEIIAWRAPGTAVASVIRTNAEGRKVEEDIPPLPSVRTRSGISGEFLASTAEASRHEGPPA